MKTKQVFLAFLCLWFFAMMSNGQLFVQSQQADPPADGARIQQDSERHKNISRSLWDGRVASISTEALLHDPAFRAALGVSDEYYQKIQASVRNAVGHISDDPEYREVMREAGEAIQTVTGQPPWSNAFIPPVQELNEEQLEAFNRSQELTTRIRVMEQEFALGSSHRHVAAFEEALTPELNQKIQEAWLAAMDETSMFSPRLFEVLNLTPAQKEGMERIKKELEPELEKHLDIYSNNAAKILERVNAAFRQPDVQRAIADIGLNTYMKQLQEEPEHKRLLEESYASSKALATLFRTRMLEILNDEQRRRLQALIDNPPPHAQVLIQRLRREQWGRHEEVASDQSGKSDNAGADKDVWIPGPNALRPGDPLLPGAHRLERSSPFPRGEN